LDEDSEDVTLRTLTNPVMVDILIRFPAITDKMIAAISYLRELGKPPDDRAKPPEGANIRRIRLDDESSQQ
jgi:hypothetical protein